MNTLSRILVVSDAITATQYISFLQPLQPLVESGQIRLFFADCPKTQAAADQLFEAAAPDCLVLSRCTLPGGEPLVKLARHNAMPYVYHIDDDLLRVPQSLGADKFKAYNNPARLKRLTGNCHQSVAGAVAKHLHHPAFWFQREVPQLGAQQLG